MTDKYSWIKFLVYVLFHLIIFYILWPNVSEWQSQVPKLVIFVSLFFISTWLTLPYRKIFHPDSVMDICVIIRHTIIWGGIFALLELLVFKENASFPYLKVIGYLSALSSGILLLIRLIRRVEVQEAIKPIKRSRIKLEYALTTEARVLDQIKNSPIEDLNASGILLDSLILIPDGSDTIKILPKPLKSYLNINNKLSELYDNLVNGGVALLHYTPEDNREEKILALKPRLLARCLYVLYLFWFRALPKVPYLSQVLLYISGGQWRAISRTETWGRLLYSGFDVEKELDIGNGNFLIVARKQLEPVVGVKPSFYPIIQLNRVGYHGKTIRIFKLRSMYPYSEFLQEKVYQMNSLDNSGKFKDDFRITRYGKYFRKFWLDELPQLVNWLRGDIKIVGIRAMSFHYFSLYPQWYKDIYYTVKPGFVSPIFDENTANFDEIVNIEGDYLKKYKKNGIKADLAFFFETFFQILRGVRSK